MTWTGTTRPGALLKHLIPLKLDHWDVHQAGYLEIDLVSHSGASAAGNASAAVMGYGYAGAGSTLGPAMTFGYVAARDIAES